MTTRQFRFGVAAGLAPSAAAWQQTARHVEALGYDTLAVPDNLWTPSPFPALAAAATVTTTLRIGTHVLAAPFRTPGMVARDAETLDLLSDARFELGLGTGRPEAEEEAGRLGMPFGTAADRRDTIARTIDAIRAHFTALDRPAPPIVLAGVGPRLVSLATERASTLTLPFAQELTDEELGPRVDTMREQAGAAGFDALELGHVVYVVGDEVPLWMRRHVGDLPDGSYARLTGKPREIADTLLRRRDRLGISYVVISQPFAETFAPVLELLADA